MELKNILEELGKLNNHEERKLKRRMLLQRIVDPEEHKKNVERTNFIRKAHKPEDFDDWYEKRYGREEEVKTGPIEAHKENEFNFKVGDILKHIETKLKVEVTWIDKKKKKFEVVVLDKNGKPSPSGSSYNKSTFSFNKAHIFTLVKPKETYYDYAAKKLNI